MKALLQGIFTRLHLKDHRFEVFEAASELAIEELWRNILVVVNTITPEDTTKAEMRKKDGFKNFLQQHCKVRHYMFSIKKCNSATCTCRPPRLPRDVFDSIYHLPAPVPDGDHYQDFSDLYGNSETTKQYRPSLSESEKKSSGIPFSPSAQSAKMLTLLFNVMSVRSGGLFTANLSSNQGRKQNSGEYYKRYSTEH